MEADARGHERTRRIKGSARSDATDGTNGAEPKPSNDVTGPRANMYNKEEVFKPAAFWVAIAISVIAAVVDESRQAEFRN